MLLSPFLVPVPPCPGALQGAAMGGLCPTSLLERLRRGLHRGNSASRFISSSGECALSATAPQIRWPFYVPHYRSQVH